MEMTLRNLMSDEIIDHRDFLERADLLGALGKTVMISNFERFDRVTKFLRKATQASIGMVMGVPTLNEVFNEKYYADLPGGILEGFGGLFQGPVRLLVYPTKDAVAGSILTVESVEIGPHQKKLFEWLCENGSIEPIRNYDPTQLHISPAEVLRLLRVGDPGWREMVPGPVADIIERRRLFTDVAA
jgi:hypothetical protein